MYRTLLNAKIHRATVTEADLHYVGSLTIDAGLMEEAGILEGEMVQVVDIDNGARLETYAITGARGTGVIGINGAAAHLVHPGDMVIIMTFAALEPHEIAGHTPRVVHVNAANEVVEIGTDPAVPVPGDADQLSGRR
ncbi:aspartate 1-decarboxylase [Pseudonocardia endophytica]|uniref:Aspartate 1-decarboxylase n=1 Tax=Pseudonocardia endophytica TaxID=401976 RepID=A0A4R1HJQ1_PSEEN|nr:aspartate 1-decarboxylase [Pseudonocardia endophytica]TCK22557.1 L-aspartate 1-decarboxylase [Pseudonocardia endophytica]